MLETEYNMKFKHLFLVLAFGAAQNLFAVEFTRPQAGKIAYTVGRILEAMHYKQAPLDDEVSQAF